MGIINSNRSAVPWQNDTPTVQPNQELSLAKFELQEETVGVCSSYRRIGQIPHKCALRSMQMCLLVHIRK